MRVFFFFMRCGCCCCCFCTIRHTKCAVPSTLIYLFKFNAMTREFSCVLSWCYVCFMPMSSFSYRYFSIRWWWWWQLIVLQRALFFPHWYLFVLAVAVCYCHSICSLIVFFSLCCPFSFNRFSFIAVCIFMCCFPSRLSFLVCSCCCSFPSHYSPHTLSRSLSLYAVFELSRIEQSFVIVAAFGFCYSISLLLELTLLLC